MKAMNNIERYNLYASALQDFQEPHSLYNQLSALYWDIGVFKAKMLSWGYGKKENASTAPLFYEYLLHTTALYLVSSLRRMTERGSLDAGRNDVISLYSIVDDMEHHRGELTRRVVFEAQGLTYDIESVRRDAQEFSTIQRRKGRRTYSVPHHLWIDPIVHFHRAWDSLSNTTEQERSQEDCIRQEWFASLKDRIEAIHDEIKTIANKWYLHAATPKSRNHTKEEEVDWLSLDHLINLSLACGSIYGELCRALGLGFITPLDYLEPQFKWRGWRATASATKEELEEEWLKWEKTIQKAIIAS